MNSPRNRNNNNFSTYFPPSPAYPRAREMPAYVCERGWVKEVREGRFNRYSRAGVRRRRLREQPPTTTDFLSVGRSGLAARLGHTTPLSNSCPMAVQSPSNLALGQRATTLARVAAGMGLAIATTIRNLGHTAQRRPSPEAWAKLVMNINPEAKVGPDSPSTEATP